MEFMHDKVDPLLIDSLNPAVPPWQDMHAKKQLATYLALASYPGSNSLGTRLTWLMQRCVEPVYSYSGHAPLRTGHALYTASSIV